MKHDYHPMPGQTDRNIAKNIAFFRENYPIYNHNIQNLDTYITIRHAVNEALQGINQLLDIGNGGVFDYDTTIVKSIVALDLSFNDIPLSFSCPDNVILKAGSALEIHEPDQSFDGVLIVMLLHHLVGKTVKASLANTRRAVREALRVLQPGGKLVILESCVPPWFYGFERTVFPLASAVINRVLAHPVTLQYPASLIANIIEEYNPGVGVMRIPKGRWILQFGFKFPAALTPASPYRFVVHKHDRAM